MGSQSVRGHLRAAAAALEAARDSRLDEEGSAYVSGLIELVERFCEETLSSAESHALPQSGALHTMELRLDDLAERTETDAADHLRTAKDHIQAARDMMDDRFRDGYELPRGSRGQ